MVMIGLYAKRYCCLAIDCRVIYKKNVSSGKMFASFIICS